jgi:hypothetical protein
VRRLYLLLIVLAVLLFLGISTLLARAFNAEGDERSAITALIVAQAGGDVTAATAAINRCDATPGCPSHIRQLARSLRRPGQVELLQLQPSTGFSLAGTIGMARVAWHTTRSPRPVVQCVTVRRAGDVLAGLHVQLLTLSAPIPGGSDCPPAGG